MKYLLVLGIIFEKYKRPAKITITTENTFIDEFSLDEDKPGTQDFLEQITHNKDDMYKKHNRARIEAQFINKLWPNYFKVYELERLPLGDGIKIQVENNNSDYTNGFMRKSSIIKFPIIAFFPKHLIAHNGKPLMDFMLNIEDGFEISKVAKSGNQKMQWLSIDLFNVTKNDEHEDSKIVNGHEPIGGSFSINLKVKRKHNIDYIYQDLHGWAGGKKDMWIEQCSDVGFWMSRGASSLLLASCGQLLNIYNEDQ
jgi:hypothetical protein